MPRKLIIIVIIICSLLLYDFKFLGRFSKILELAGIVLMLVTSIFYAIYDDSFRFKHNFTLIIFIILLSLPFSMYIANLFHNQSIGLTLFAQRSLYFYLLYFLLHQLKIRPKDFEKIFFVLAFVYIGLYLLQYILFPTVIFNATVFKDRGTLRMFLYGLSYMMVAYFLALQILLRTNQMKYLVFLLIALTIIIMIGSRMLLFSVATVTLINLAIEKRIRSKMAIYGLVLAGIIFLFFAFQNVFQELVSVTKETRAEGLDNIRVKAAKYFLSRFFPNKFAYVFGNGASGSQSEYSSIIGFLANKYGYFLSDIGIIGNYVNYGVLFVAGVFVLIYKVLRIKIQPLYHYIKYFFVLNALCLVIAGGFAQSDFIVLVCVSLYILDVSNHDVRAGSPATATDLPDKPEQAVNLPET